MEYLTELEVGPKIIKAKEMSEDGLDDPVVAEEEKEDDDEEDDLEDDMDDDEDGDDEALEGQEW